MQQNPKKSDRAELPKRKKASLPQRVLDTVACGSTSVLVIGGTKYDL